MPKTTGSRAFAQILQGYGVTHVFFVPAIMLQALAEMEETNIRRVMTHGEKAAAYMADGYARASGRPGVCMAQHIGASNLAAGLRDPFMACAPVIAITGGPEAGSRYRYAYQEVEDFCQFEPVTKFSACVEDVSRLPDLLRQAFRMATAGVPRPVHLRVRGLRGESTEEEGDLEPLVEAQFRRAPAFRPEPEMRHLLRALELLVAAERPIIVAGGGVTLSRAEPEVVALAERLQMPVATSLNAKGTIADGHPLSVGVVGAYSRSCANRAVSEADLVFFIGSHTGGQVTNHWTVPAKGTRVIQLDIAPDELGRNYPNTVGLPGDAKATLQRLIALVPARPGAAAEAWTKKVQDMAAGWRAEMAPFLNSEAVPMRPERICREISAALPEDGIVVSDTGHAGIWSGTMIDLTRPGQRYIRCAGSLGWGFPGSLGVKCALPDRPVLCFTGDGGMYYHLAELETAARYGINVVVVVNNNGALNQSTPLFDAAYGGTQRGRAGEMWRFLDTDFAKVAESLGCAGFRVKKPGELGELLPRAFALGRPVVIDAQSDVRALAQKPWKP